VLDGVGAGGLADGRGKLLFVHDPHLPQGMAGVTRRFYLNIADPGTNKLGDDPLVRYPSRSSGYVRGGRC
jgi:hypothetical protein